MEENKNENLGGSTFKATTDKSVYTTYTNSSENSKGGSGFLMPFFSGVLGTTLVLGITFGVPPIRDMILGDSYTNSSNTSLSSPTENSGLVDQVSLTEYSDTSIYAANKVMPSIVGIKVEYMVNSNMSFFGNTQSSTATATGSGIIISNDGYILTNNHIVSTSSSSSNSYYEVSDATKVTVTLFGDETEYEATIVGMDEQTDLAVIKIEKSDLIPAEFADSDSIKVGEFAMAVGNPLGLDSTVTTGIVSGINREVTDSEGQTFNLIQTDAAINSGNSGGALVNSKGQVIGVNTLKMSGDGVEAMGFAIPINSTIDITSQLIEFNKVKRPYIGITGLDLDETTAKTYDLVVGVYIKAIDDFSAAEKGGLKVGDVITHVDGREIKTVDEMNKIKEEFNIGDELKITVNRNGETKELTITLGEQP